MIASGGLSGGLSSSIAGGKFWDGFRQGIITSGLNHAMHGVIDNNKVRTKNKVRIGKNGGEVHNLFSEDDSLIDWPDNIQTEKNTIKIVGHGNAKRVAGMDANNLHDYLMQNSELYLSSINNGIPIVIKLYSCLTAGNTYGSYKLEGNNIATDLSIINKNAEIIAPSSTLSKFGIRGDGLMISHINGKTSISQMNFFCGRQTKTFFTFNSYTGKSSYYKFYQLNY
jgi:hypothetical protein